MVTSGGGGGASITGGGGVGCRSGISIDSNSVIFDWRSLFKPVYNYKTNTHMNPILKSDKIS